MRPLRQLRPLHHHVLPANHQCNPHPHGRPEHSKLLANLYRQLARGGEDDGKHAVRVLRQMVENGQRKGGRFARTGLRTTHHVAAAQDGWDAGALDVEWPDEAHRGGTLAQPVAQTQFSKGPSLVVLSVRS
jgi:hypothetical protein